MGCLLPFPPGQCGPQNGRSSSFNICSHLEALLVYTTWQILMAQIIDLGSHSFKTDCLREPCLVSRATATLVCNDNTNATEPTNCKFELQSAWITLKQELTVDLHIEAYSESVPSMPNFVKQVVDTIQVSLVSSLQKAYHRFIDTVNHPNRSVTARISGCRQYIMNIAAWMVQSFFIFLSSCAKFPIYLLESYLGEYLAKQIYAQLSLIHHLGLIVQHCHISPYI